MQDILVGVILGGLMGFALFSLLYHTSDVGPTLVFFAKEDNSKKCKLSKQNLDAHIVKIFDIKYNDLLYR